MDLIKVFITEDESVVREGLRDIIPWENTALNLSEMRPTGKWRFLLYASSSRMC